MFMKRREWERKDLWAQLSGDGGGFGQSRSLDRFNMSETVSDPVGQVRGFQAFTVHDVFTSYFIYYPINA